MKYLLVIILFIGASCSDYSEELSGEYVFVSESNTCQYIRPRKGDLEIKQTVISYAFNDDFIIAAQIDNKDDLYVLNGKNINFWIISHKTKGFYGPLTLNDYLKLRMKLQIPEDVKLELEL